MGDQVTKVPEAPGTDSPEAPIQKKSPRSKRYGFYPDGKDVVVLSIARDAEGNPIDNGALSAVPEVPRFDSASEATKWVRASGDKLVGMTLLVAKMQKRIEVLAEAKPQVVVREARRHERIEDPADTQGSAG